LTVSVGHRRVLHLGRLHSCMQVLVHPKKLSGDEHPSLFAQRSVTKMKEVFYQQHQAGLTMQPSEAYDTNFVEDVSTIDNIYIRP
jgi:hypothetical protein